MFPPGRDMLCTKPKLTGSLVITTIGMVDVASLRGTTIRLVNAKDKIGIASCDIAGELRVDIGTPLAGITPRLPGSFPLRSRAGGFPGKARARTDGCYFRSARRRATMDGNIAIRYTLRRLLRPCANGSMTPAPMNAMNSRRRMCPSLQGPRLRKEEPSTLWWGSVDDPLKDRLGSKATGRLPLAGTQGPLWPENRPDSNA